MTAILVFVVGLAIVAGVVALMIRLDKATAGPTRIAARPAVT